MTAVQQMEAATKALYTATDQSRQAAEAYLCSLFPPPASPPIAPQGSSSHVFASHPHYLPTLQSILGGSGCPFSWLFSLGSLIMCLDNSWHSIPHDVRWELRTFLLQWLAEKGPSCEALGQQGHGARSSAITALCRITKLCWREDSRHHATAAHALQFLGASTREHWPLGLQLWSRLVDDMQRPHPHLKDKPTVRLLMFRDLALRPLFTRLVAVLQELLTAAHAAAAALADTPPGSHAQQQQQQLGRELTAILDLACSALELVESVIAYDFGCGLGGGELQAGGGGEGGEGGGREGGEEEEEEEEDGGNEEEYELGGLGGGGEGDNGSSAPYYDMREIECASLPSSWSAVAHLGAVAPVFAWMRLALALHVQLPGLESAGGTAVPSPYPPHPAASQPMGCLDILCSSAEPLILRLGRLAIRAASASVATKSVFYTPRVEAARTRLFMSQTTLLLAYILHSPRYRSLAGSAGGWVHESSRLLFRLKLALPLAMLSRYPKLTIGFLSMATHWTYCLLGKVNNSSSSTQGAPGGVGRAPTPAPLASSNTAYYLLSFWVLLLLPTVHLAPGELIFGMLQTALPHIADALLDRFAPLRRAATSDAPCMGGSGGGGGMGGGGSGSGLGFAGGSGASGNSSMFLAFGDLETDPECAAEEDADEVLGGSGGSGGDAVEDDTIELAAEVCKYHTLHSAARASARMEALLDVLQSSTLSPALARDTQRSLAWLVRFAALLTNTVLSDPDNVPSIVGRGAGGGTWDFGSEAEGGGGEGTRGLTSASPFPSLHPEECKKRCLASLDGVFLAVRFRDPRPAAAAAAAAAASANARHLQRPTPSISPAPAASGFEGGGGQGAKTKAVPAPPARRCGTAPVPLMSQLQPASSALRAGGRGK